MHKLLFPIDIKEFEVNQGRILRLVQILAADGYKVDILTPSDEVHAKAAETFKGNESVAVSLAKSESVPLPDSFRDDFLKTIIRQTHKLLIPETDMKIYKLAAFDDFRGFLAPYTYPDMDISLYSLILMPILSLEGYPTSVSDCFYSAVCFLAKEKGVTLIGLLTQPAVHSPLLYMKMMDYIVVKDLWEKRYIEQLGIESERIFLLTDEREVYCLKFIEDKYKNDALEFMDNKDILIGKNEFCIGVINHPNFRPQIRQILFAIGQMNIPAVVLLVKVGYYVKELDEQEIVDSVYGDIISKMNCRLYILGHGYKNKVYLLPDLLVAATYWESLSLAAGCKKTAIVFNKIFRDLETGDGVIFMDDPEELKEVILRRYNEKKAGYSCLSDLVGRICGNTKKSS